jgi:LexA-binding, inner membrane-associated putative hydrolase
MPNRAAHVLTSTAAGALFAAHRSGNQTDASRLCELAGGFIGGYAGGRAPDICEPPTTPRHRGSAHSAGAGAILVKVCTRDLDDWQRGCRTWADGFAQKRRACPSDSAEAVLFALAETLCRVLAGLIAGFLAGYVMHLTLDACTPSCISLI